MISFGLVRLIGTRKSVQCRDRMRPASEERQRPCTSMGLLRRSLREEVQKLPAEGRGFLQGLERWLRLQDIVFSVYPTLILFLNTRLKSLVKFMRSSFQGYEFERKRTHRCETPSST